MTAYLSAPGVRPVRIHAYPKRRRGFMNDAELQSLDAARARADVATPLASTVTELRSSSRDDPRYSDFFAPGRELEIQASA
jgi:hypothetical protein